MAEYQLVVDHPHVVQRTSDGAMIPFDPANRDYQEYLEWKTKGNEPDPAPEEGAV